MYLKLINSYMILFSGFEIRPHMGSDHHVKKLNSEISPSYSMTLSTRTSKGIKIRFELAGQFT